MRHIVDEIKKLFPYVTNTMFISYHPNSYFDLPLGFDGSVYLLEDNVPPKFAIYHTNRRVVDISDFIIFGVNRSYGGAFAAYKYAERKHKKIFNILEE